MQHKRALDVHQRIQARRRAIEKRPSSQPDVVKLIRSLQKGNARREF